MALALSNKWGVEWGRDQKLGSQSVLVSLLFKIFMCLVGFVDTGFLCAALAILELAVLTRLASDSKTPGPGIKGVGHHCPKNE